MKVENVIQILQTAVSTLSVMKKHGGTQGTVLSVDQMVRHALQELIKTNEESKASKERVVKL